MWLIKINLKSLREAEEVDQKWVKFKAAKTKAAVEQISRVIKKKNTKMDDCGYFELCR